MRAGYNARISRPWHARGWVNLLKFGERFMDYEYHIRQSQWVTHMPTPSQA